MGGVRRPFEVPGMPRRARRSQPEIVSDSPSDVTVEVSNADAPSGASTEEERLIRERITEYFAILREWSLNELADDSSPDCEKQDQE